MDKLMMPTGKSRRHSYQGRTLFHSYYEQDYTLNVEALKIYLKPRQTH